MAKLDVKFFTNANDLQHISIDYLVEFILCFPDFCSNHNFSKDNAEKLTHNNIADAISSSIKAQNKTEYEKLLNDFQNIKEMASIANRSLLRKELEKNNITIPNGRKLSDYNFTIYVWRYHYEIFTAIHARYRIKNYQSFLYFLGSHKNERDFPEIEKKAVLEIERELNEWFDKNDRVPNAEVTFYAEQDVVSIVIKYGMPLSSGTDYAEDKQEKGFCFHPIR